MAKPTPGRVLGGALDALQIILALVVIVLTSWKLFSGSVKDLDELRCLLDGTKTDGALSGTRFCVYVVMVGVISLVAGALVGCARKLCACVTLGVMTGVVEILGNIVLGAWWAIAFVLLLKRGRAANDLGWPERTSRDAVIGSAFGAMVSFFLDAVLTVCGMVM